MTRARVGRRSVHREAQEILDQADSSLLDLVDHLLTKGVVVSGEVVMGVAGIDLIYIRLSAIICAADRVIEAARSRS